MKLFALICLFGLATASDWQWQNNKQYVYNYSGRLLTGLPELQSQYSGIGLQCEVIVQVQENQKLYLQLKNVQYVKVNDVLQDGPSHEGHNNGEASSNWRKVQLPQTSSVPAHFQQVLESPVTFELSNGEVKTLIVSETEPVWSINIKKSLVTLFQTKQGISSLDIQGNRIPRGSSNGETVWKTQEMGIDGQCENTYQLNELPEYMVKDQPQVIPYPEACTNGQYYELIKTKDVNSCDKRSSFTYYKPGFFNCPTGNCDGMWSRSSITRYFGCGTPQNLVLQTIINEGELSQNLLGVKTEKFVTGTQQIFSLKNIKTISQRIPEPQQPHPVESLMYVYEHMGTSGRDKWSVSGSQEFKGRVSQSVAENENIRNILPRSQSSKDVNPSQIKTEVKKWMQRLMTDLLEVESVPEKQITMQILSLSRGLSMLGQEDIKEVYQQMKQQYSGSQDNHETFKNLFFDCCSVAGTNPNLKFLIQMIKSEEVSQVKAASVLMFLPHYIVTPTQELLQEIFHLVKSEKVQQHQFLYNNAVLGFSNLIQKACLSENRKTMYPTSVFGEFCNPNSEIVTSQWIPYLKSQLNQAQSQQKKNLIVVSLGQMTHKTVIPTLLPLVENYTHVHEMTRLLSVYSLGSSGKQMPTKVAYILQAVFNNPSESTEIRKAAFNSLLKLNPPMSIIQQIASSTWNEKNDEILKVVYTALKSLSEQLEIDPLQSGGSSSSSYSLQRKAWMVLPFMKNINGFYPSSATLYGSDYLPQLGLGYQSIDSWTGSKDSVLPKEYYSRLEYFMGRYHFKPYEFGVKFNGFENLYQQFYDLITPIEEGKTAQQERNEHFEHVKRQLNKQWRNVIEQLKIKSREDTQMSGMVYLNLFEDSSIFGSFGDFTVEQLREKISPLLKNPLKLRESICGQHSINSQRAMDYAPSEFLIPSDMGLPIIIEVHMPTALSVRGHMNVECSSQQNQLPSNVKLTIQTLFTSQYSGSVGTFIPFTQETVSTGVQEHTVLNLPTETNINANLEQGSVQVSLKPLSKVNKQVSVLHYHIRPFTVSLKTSELTPQTLSEQVKFIKSNEPKQQKIFTFGQQFGLQLKSIIQSESRYLDMQSLKQMSSMFNNNVMNMFRFSWASTAISPSGKPSVRTHLYSLIYDPTESATKEITFNLKFGYSTKEKNQEPKYHSLKMKTQEDRQQEHERHQQRNEQEDKESKREKVLRLLSPYKLESKNINQEIHPRRQDMLKNAFQRLNVQSGQGLSVIINVLLKGSRTRSITQKISIAGGSHDMMNKWDVQLQNEQAEEFKHICINGHVQIPGVPSWNLDMIRSSNIDFLYHNKIQFGQQCSQEGSMIQIDGNSKVSSQQKQRSRDSREGRECQRKIDQQQRGAMSSQACKKAREQALTVDEVDFKIQYQKVPSFIPQYERQFVSGMKALLWPYVQTGRSIHEETRQSSGSPNTYSTLCQLMFQPQHNTFDFTINRPQEVTKFRGVRIPYPFNVFVPGVAGQNSFKRGLQRMTGYSVYPTCDYEGGLIRTFDNKSLPANMDGCFHLLSGDCGRQHEYAVLVRTPQQSSPNMKQVQILLQDLTIRLGPSHSYSKYRRDIDVEVNDEKVQLGKQETKTFKTRSTKMTVSITRTIDDIIEVSSSVLSTKFNGEHIQVTASPQYKNKLCGLCGDYNNQKLGELRGPQGCVFSKPQLSIASYRIQGPGCPSMEPRIQQELEKEQQECSKVKTIPTKVKKAYQYQSGKCSRQEHVTLERSGELCFSRRPVTKCGPSCQARPSVPVTRNVSFTCMTNDRVAQHYYQKAKQGHEMPELQGKSESFSSELHLPESCVPIEH